jgi:hypothetical protein
LSASEKIITLVHGKGRYILSSSVLVQDVYIIKTAWVE